MPRRVPGEKVGRADIVAAGSSPRLYQRVVDILGGQIRLGVLAAEAELTETGVASRFGISRAPARRALAELELAGLIARGGGRGFVVVAPRRGQAARPLSHKAGAPDSLKLVSQPSWERIYRDVEAEIVARISFTGWRVNEAMLARFYGVSRTVARDVVSRLHQRGIVQKDDRSRWYAPALTRSRVGELYELREVLEPVALAQAAPRLPAGLLDRLHADIAETQACARVGTVGGETLDRLEHDLHVTLLGHCPNRALVQAIIYPQSLLIAHRFLYQWTARLFAPEPFLPEHLAIIEHLQAGRVAKAAGALRQHLRVSRDRAMARINVIAGGAQPDPLPYLTRWA